MKFKGFLLTLTIPTMLSAAWLSDIKPVKADSWIDRNPWTLNAPLVASPSYTDGDYKKVVFQGNAEQLSSYIQAWGLKIHLFAEGRERVSEGFVGEGRLWAVCHLTVFDPDYNTVTCVAVNARGRALDRNIYRQDYRTNVYNKFVDGELASRD